MVVITRTQRNKSRVKPETYSNSSSRLYSLFNEIYVFTGYYSHMYKQTLYILS